MFRIDIDEDVLSDLVNLVRAKNAAVRMPGHFSVRKERRARISSAAHPVAEYQVSRTGGNMRPDSLSANVSL
jgi:hypothetical protein